MSRVRSDPPFAKKSFGQNFLIDQNFIDKIINAANPGLSDTVVEIGPGRGALTGRLLDQADQVIAVEFDRDMASFLREKFAGCSNFGLIEADAVNLDFASVLRTGHPLTKLVANLPYNVSTAILQSLAKQKALFSEMVLMFQREVAERITAKPGTSERGYLTVIVEASFNVERLFDVPPAAFRPTPKIWSTVVKLTPKFVEIANEPLFRELVSAGFSQRRKTIQNNLKTLYPDVHGLLERSNIEPNRRAETLTLDEWLNLSRNVS